MLGLLSRQARQRIITAAEPVVLALGHVLCEEGSQTRHVYFPTSGFISLVTAPFDEAALEVGMVGREGMLGAHLALGVGTTPLRALVQGAGAAHRLTAGDFRRELGHSPSLQRTLDRYLYVLMAQLSTSAACTRFHHVGPRLARWLLMSQDRAQADSFHLTQEFLAYMLGVRRVGITDAARLLQQDGLIAYHRGEITVLDRARLEVAACPCYAADRQAYRRLMG